MSNLKPFPTPQPIIRAVLAAALVQDRRAAPKPCVTVERTSR
jgi:hypothetical protein